MKKNIYIVLFGLLLSIGAVSCDNETDMLFEETAAERKTAAIQEFDEALKSSEQGWLFQYFPEETQKYGGFNYVVKFNQHDSVSVWTELVPDAEPEISLYDLISYGGPVLTFNTYNPFMHAFATPSAAEYNAKGGDSEFLLMSNDEAVISVKGTKTGNDMRLIKMTETPEAYFAKAKEVLDFLGGASFGTVVDGTEVTIILAGRQLTFVYNDGKEDVNETIAFVYTDKGIRLYKPVEILNASAQDFTLNKESKQFIADNGELTVDIAFAPIDLTLARWSLDTSVETDRSDAIKIAWDNAHAANNSTWGENLYGEVFMGLCYAAYNDIGMSFYSFTAAGKAYRSHYNLSFGGVVGHEDYLNVIKIDGGFNWKWYGHFETFVNVVANNAPYITEMDDAENPTQVKLTSAANPEVWFILRQ
ncbi:DUF4302 domain-containing protein [Labilibaculum sp. DW002]|uniref:DUF4302 domain-containing protein n=1 Tax=Paralabilibaculum antarcticum TaxID=2912572 RepID=A0ABT5VV41_9BACT|nr:DUF4302 domain-containing protein [Labilibaculum sp. DW002]MDE5419272.1 DUF4302 domain-containing protein [Labilibaculum sp. DW002]